MIVSRCGLLCGSLNCNENFGCNCSGCANIDKPFWGNCEIKDCCEGKGLAHCGECDIVPCSKLYAFSYLNPEHGDKPQGARVQVCRQWAAESGKQVWGNVLLTSAGWWRTFEGDVKKKIRDCFLEMLGKPANTTKVLFIPTAAIDDEARLAADKCKEELLDAGILAENIVTYDIDGSLSGKEAMEYDVIYFTGGSTSHLLKRVKETGFDEIVKRMVYANKVYVGASAGSIIATPNIGEPYNEETAGLALANVYLSVHCPPDSQPRTDLPLPHVSLTDEQALVVSWNGYKVIEG